MDSIHALSAIFENANCDFSVYDLGRRVSRIEREPFKAIEDNRLPYPYPLRQYAHMAVAFWQPKQQPWIWFLKMPLDERGLLNQAAMGDFIQYVAQAMGATLGSTPTEEQREKLANNPYTFSPSDDKMAMFHALLTHQLGLPASQYYDHAQHYLGGELDWSQWQGVGLQGLADICARMSRQNNVTRLRKALHHLPETPKYGLLGCLEHCEIPESLAVTILDLIEKELEGSDVDLFLLTALVRAMSGAPIEQRDKAIDRALNLPILHHREMFIAIAGRCWETLHSKDRLEHFLLLVAETKEAQLFQHIFADLVLIPKLRPNMLQLLHGQASEALLNALNDLQRNVKQTQ